MAEETDQQINGNFYALTRNLENHWIDRSNDYLAMWVRLLRKTAWRDNGELKRGQVVWDYKYVGGPGLTERRTRGFLKKLLESGEVVVARYQHGNQHVGSKMVLTICNWDKYQSNGNGHSNGHGIEHGSSTVRSNSITTGNQNEKGVSNNNNNNNNNTSSEKQKKERKTRHPDYKETSDYIWNTYKAQYGKKPPAPSKKFWDQLDGRIREYSGKIIREAWDSFLADPFWATQKHPPQAFVGASVLVRFLPNETDNNWETELEAKLVRAPVE